MSDNPAIDAFDDAESTAETDSSNDDDDLEEWLGTVRDGPKSETIGVSVTPELLYLYRELTSDDDVQIDVRESFRDNLEKLANRYPDAADRARRKYEIDHEE